MDNEFHYRWWSLAFNSGISLFVSGVLDTARMALRLQYNPSQGKNTKLCQNAEKTQHYQIY